MELCANRAATPEYLKLYIDGILRVQDVSISSSGSLDNGEALYIADDNDGSSEFTGDIDEVKFYKLAFTADQVKVEYNQGSATVWGAATTNTSGSCDFSARGYFCPPGNTEGNCAAGQNPAPSFWYKLDENQDNTCAPAGDDTCDSSSNVNGTNTNMESNDWVPGKLGSGLSYDGNNEYTILLDNTANKVNGSSYTLETWIYPRAFPGASSWDTFILKNSQYAFELNDTDDVNFDFFYSPGSWTNHDATNANLTTDRWYHLAGVFDNTNNLVKIYVNGIQVLSEAETNEPQTSTS